MASRRKPIELPESNAEVEQTLFERGIILPTNEIDDDAYDKLWSQLLFLEAAGSPPIEIRFDSLGGDTLPGFLMYDLIRRYKGKTTGIIIREANSITSIIFQACKVRKMTQHAWMHIHTPSSFEKLSLAELEKQGMVKDLIVGLKKSCAQMIDVYALRASISRDAIRTLMDEDRHLFAEEALRLGFVDEII